MSGLKWLSGLGSFEAAAAIEFRHGGGRRFSRSNYNRRQQAIFTLTRLGSPDRCGLQ